MAVIARHLPDATRINVGRRPEFEAFHTRKVIIARGVAVPEARRAG